MKVGFLKETNLVLGDLSKVSQAQDGRQELALTRHDWMRVFLNKHIFLTFSHQSPLHLTHIKLLSLNNLKPF